MKKFSAVIAIALIFSLVFSGCASSDNKATYKSALEHYNNQTYSLAYDEFASLGDYKDSQEYANEICYLNGINYMKSGNYDLARTWLSRCDEYKDASEICKSISSWRVRSEGIQALKDGDYTLAFDKFSKIADFEDVPEILEKFSALSVLSSETYKFKDNLDNVSIVTVTYTYNSNGQLIRVDGSGNVLPHSSNYTHAFDGNYSDCCPSYEVYSYNDDGQLAKIEGRYGYEYRSEFYYNDDGTVAYEDITTSNDSGKTEYFYDNKGQLISISTKGTPTTYFTYNANGQLTEESRSGLGFNFRYVYSYEGDNVVSCKLYNYGSEYATVQYENNAAGQIVKATTTYADSNQGSLTITYEYAQFYEGDIPEIYLY